MRTPSIFSSPHLALVAALGLALAGCRQDAVTYTRVAKAPAAAAPDPAAGDPAAANPKGDMSASGAAADGLPPAPRPTGAAALRWKLPAGWTEEQGGSMRYATLRPPGGGAEASVVVLPGPAGGELGNVNRWRGQLGLPPLDEAALLSARASVDAPAGKVSLYDFTSAGEPRTRTVAGFVAVADHSWFVKLTGGEGPVAAARPTFLELLGSLHRE